MSKFMRLSVLATALFCACGNPPENQNDSGPSDTGGGDTGTPGVDVVQDASPDATDATTGEASVGCPFTLLTAAAVQACIPTLAIPVGSLNAARMACVSPDASASCMAYCQCVMQFYGTALPSPAAASCLDPQCR